MKFNILQVVINMRVLGIIGILFLLSCKTQSLQNHIDNEVMVQVPNQSFMSGFGGIQISL